MDSIESINDIINRYNNLYLQYSNGKENMNLINEQIIKSNQ